MGNKILTLGRRYLEVMVCCLEAEPERSVVAVVLQSESQLLLLAHTAVTEVHAIIKWNAFKHPVE